MMYFVFLTFRQPPRLNPTQKFFKGKFMGNLICFPVVEEVMHRQLRLCRLTPQMNIG